MISKSNETPAGSSLNTLEASETANDDSGTIARYAICDLLEAEFIAAACFNFNFKFGF
jgi:hypothetical protein